MTRFGIDLGGTKIEIAALDERNDEVLRRRVPTPRGDYRATLEAIVALIHSAEDELGIRAPVGIGTPGTLARSGLIKNANSTWLNGRPLKNDLKHLLGRSVCMSNDANCFALSEATDGAARGAGVVFAAILGTGVGGGIAAFGRVHDGPNGIAGEWGHTQLPWRRDDETPGPLCYCGKYGCIETFLSGPARARDDNAPLYEDRLARGLAGIVNVLDPDVIVLGGGVSNVETLYANLPNAMQPYVFSDTFETPILRAKHGDSSGVRGAAMLGETTPDSGR